MATAQKKTHAMDKKDVRLSDGDSLTLDMHRGLVRMAYYRSPVPQARTAERVRTSHKARTLSECLTVLLGEADSPHDPDTVEWYIRSTPWGRDLP